MKHAAAFITLFFVILIVALVLSAADLANKDRASGVLTPWLPPKLTLEPSQPAPPTGWWDELPTPLPFPSATPRK